MGIHIYLTFIAGPEQIGVVEMDASSSSSLSVRWSQQPKTNGLVTQYTVTATPLSTVGLDSPNGEIRLSTVEIEVCILGITRTILLITFNLSLVPQSRTQRRTFWTRTGVQLFACP